MEKKIGSAYIQGILLLSNITKEMVEIKFDGFFLPESSGE
jgi:hypothetical protein